MVARTGVGVGQWGQKPGRGPWSIERQAMGWGTVLSAPPGWCQRQTKLDAEVVRMSFHEEDAIVIGKRTSVNGLHFALYRSN